MTSKAYRENYKAIRWTIPKDQPRRIETKGQSGPFFLPDITPFQSPIDFTEISSRSALREHERKHGVRQCGELKRPEEFSNNRETFSEKAFESAYRDALGKHGLL